MSRDFILDNIEGVKLSASERKYLASNNYRFFYIDDGSCDVSTYAINSQLRKTFALKKHEALLIFPDAKVKSLIVKANDCAYELLEFGGEQVDKIFRYYDLTKKQSLFEDKHDAEGNFQLKKLLNDFLENAESSSVKLTGLGFLFMDQLIKNKLADNFCFENKEAAKNTYIQNAIDFIDKNYNQDIEVNFLASASNLSRSYFSQLFKQYTNVNPMEYITNLRMEKARELLLGTDWLIKDIAKEVGYANALYFSRVFKQTFNVSPQVFRQRNIV